MKKFFYGFKRIFSNMVYFLPVLTFFDSYYLFKISTFPVTISFIGIAIVLVYGILKKQLSNGNIIFLLLLVFDLLLSSIFGKFDINSILLYLFFFSTFAFSKHNYDKSLIIKSMKLFVLFANIFGIIAIFQMLSNFINIPRIDIIIPGHMVEGFNRTNMIHYFGRYFYRSNSLYLEPSSLSQYSAIAIVFGIYLYKMGAKKKLWLFLIITLNIISIITAFAGTGILLLLVLFVVYLFTERHSFKTYLLIFSCIIVLTIYLLTNNSYLDYIHSRLLEVFNPSLSGGMRFTFPYYALLKSLIYHPFAFGAGNEYSAILLYYKQLASIQPTFASGYAKLGVELGFVGLILLFYTLMVVNKKEFKYIYVIVILINFLGGNLLRPYFWVFLIFLNFKKTMEQSNNSKSFEILNNINTVELNTKS